MERAFAFTEPYERRKRWYILAGRRILAIEQPFGLFTVVKILHHRQNVNHKTAASADRTECERLFTFIL